MAQQPNMSPYPVSDFLQWKGADQLELTPKFQRRDVWPAKAKSYLIDSIVRKMPIPAVFLRLRTLTDPPRTVREVVDGQQRLLSVLNYIAGEFPILSVHNSEYGGMRYGDLPEDVKQDILSYKFQVNTLENVTDAEILRIFARLNTYTEKLKHQELLNAEFFGAFKQTVYDIALRYYPLWSGKRIFTDMQIARMAEAEFTSELVISMVGGLRNTKAPQIRSYYRKYDDDFPRSREVSDRFDRVINLISEAYGDELSKSPFRRLPFFYSLFLAVYDRQFGLPVPQEDEPQLALVEQRPQRQVRPAILGRNLRELKVDMEVPIAGTPVAAFIEAGAKATADPGKRRARHAFLTDRLFNE